MDQRVSKISLYIVYYVMYCMFITRERKKERNIISYGLYQLNAIRAVLSSTSGGFSRRVCGIGMVMNDDDDETNRYK